MFLSKNTPAQLSCFWPSLSSICVYWITSNTASCCIWICVRILCVVWCLINILMCGLANQVLNSEHCKAKKPSEGVARKVLSSIYHRINRELLEIIRSIGHWRVCVNATVAWRTGWCHGEWFRPYRGQILWDESLCRWKMKSQPFKVDFNRVLMVDLK